MVSEMGRELDEQSKDMIKSEKSTLLKQRNRKPLSEDVQIVWMLKGWNTPSFNQLQSSGGEGGVESEV
jgi:hypothetical protein